jgi:hypothetical protein
MMNGKKPRSRTSILLFILFGITVMCLVGMIGSTNATHPGIGVHLHAVAGSFMTVATFFHMVHHRSWFVLAIKGKLKGRALTRLTMNTLVFILLIAACLSGPTAMATMGINPFHAIVGSGVVLGLFFHCTKRIRQNIRIVNGKARGAAQSPLGVKAGRR